MKQPPIPYNEQERLDSLNSLNVLYTPAEHRFDRITELASKLFDVPMCLVSLVSGNCQWFKSVQGLTVSSTSRESSFCAHAILQTGPFIVKDALLNPDFADNPLVTGFPHIRFYAGAQLVHGSNSIGTICIIDTKPRQFSHADKETLESLAKWVENELKNPVLSQDQIDVMLRFDHDERESMLDSVTGCWKTEAIEPILAHEIQNANNKKQSINIISVTIANYASILKDREQSSADSMMKYISQKLRSFLRTTDCVFRIREDSLIAYVPNCPEEMISDISIQLPLLIQNNSIPLSEISITPTLQCDGKHYRSVADFYQSDIYTRYFSQHLLNIPASIKS